MITTLIVKAFAYKASVDPPETASHGLPMLRFYDHVRTKQRHELDGVTLNSGYLSRKYDPMRAYQNGWYRAIDALTQSLSFSHASSPDGGGFADDILRPVGDSRDQRSTIDSNIQISPERSEQVRAAGSLLDRTVQRASRAPPLCCVPLGTVGEGQGGWLMDHNALRDRHGAPPLSVSFVAGV